MRKKILIFIVSTFFQQVTFADSFSYVDEFADIINRVQLEQNTSYKVAQTAISDSCTVFMDQDNFKGKLGLAIQTEITKNPMLYPFLLHGGTLNRYCGKFSKMTAVQKSNVWVLILTVVAHFESSCSDKAHAKGPNGTAYGYYQLHKGKEADYAGRTGVCAKNASLDAKLSTKCALGMLEYQMQKTGGDLFHKGSYWDVLRPRGQSKKAHQISKAITRFSMCNPTVM